MVANRAPSLRSGRGKKLEPVRLPLSLIGRSQILAGLVDRALSVVSGLDGLAVFIHSARALSGHVEDLAQPDVAPDFRPAGLLIAVEGFTVLVGGRLIVVLQPEYPGDAIMRQ